MGHIISKNYAQTNDQRTNDQCTQELIRQAVNNCVEILKTHINNYCDVMKSIHYLQKQSTENQIFDLQLIAKLNVVEINSHIRSLGETKYALMYITTIKHNYVLDLWPCSHGMCRRLQML